MVPIIKMFAIISNHLIGLLFNIIIKTSLVSQSNSTKRTSYEEVLHCLTQTNSTTIYNTFKSFQSFRTFRDQSYQWLHL